MNSVNFIFEDGSIETRRVGSSLRGIRKGLSRPIKIDFSDIDKDKVLNYTEVDMYRFKEFMIGVSYVLQGGKPINYPQWLLDYVHGN